MVACAGGPLAGAEGSGWCLGRRGIVANDQRDRGGDGLYLGVLTDAQAAVEPVLRDRLDLKRVGAGLFAQPVGPGSRAN